MKQKMMNAASVSVFCENMAMLLGAGIQTEEALSLLGEETSDEIYVVAAKAAYTEMSKGSTLTQAIAQTQVFPAYVVETVLLGEETGCTEKVMHSLAKHYEKTQKLQNKLKSAVVYPTILLALMSVILGVLSIKVLPVFTGVYSSLAGSVSTSSYGYVQWAYVVSGVALSAVILVTGLLLCGMAVLKTNKGMQFFTQLLQKMSITKAAALRVAQAQFTASLATYVASGVNTDTALEKSSATVHHPKLKAKLLLCEAQIKECRSLAQAVYDTATFEPLYARMLLNGAHSGNYEQVLVHIADVFSQDADERIHRIIDAVEPVLAAFLVLSVGFTLLSVMLPLVGILSAIG